MKLLHYTDCHLRGNSPESRKDNYPEAVLNKLSHVYRIGREEGVDGFVFTGDFCNAHTIYSFYVMGKAIEAVNQVDVPTYAVMGQHDLIGYNVKTFESSAFRFMTKFMNFKVLQEPEWLNDGIVLLPCSWFDDIRKMEYDLPEGDYKTIMLAHQPLRHKTAPYECILTKEVAGDYDLVLSGDQHDGFDTHTIDGTIFCNPGSLARTTTRSRDRIPQIALVEVGDEVSVELREVPHEKDVFVQNIMDDDEDTLGIDAESFIRNVNDLKKESQSILDLLSKAGKQEKIPDHVLQYIIEKGNEILEEKEK